MDSSRKRSSSIIYQISRHLDNRLKWNEDNEQFLPEDAVAEIVTQTVLSEAFDEAQIHDENRDDLLTWVLECGKRLFLILVQIVVVDDLRYNYQAAEQYLPRLKDFKDAGVNDDALPVCPDERIELFEHWDEASKAFFMLFQS
ncbi:hypothetical protein F5Y16DRAFT_416657 [Xylariaceae sp. FL0255]|nr:hypothetical protein F5Y16DRAFT_416657 [Xylariaceae sp. FL0255]